MNGGRLAAIKKRCAKVTPGPWWNESGVIHCANPGIWTEENHSCIHPATIAEPYWENARPDQQHIDGSFIVSAREDVPWLVDQVEAAKKRCEWLRSRLNSLRDQARERGKGYLLVAVAELEELVTLAAPEEKA